MTACSMCHKSFLDKKESTWVEKTDFTEAFHRSKHQTARNYIYRDYLGHNIRNFGRRAFYALPFLPIAIKVKKILQVIAKTREGVAQIDSPVKHYLQWSNKTSIG